MRGAGEGSLEREINAAMRERTGRYEGDESLAVYESDARGTVDSAARGDPTGDRRETRAAAGNKTGASSSIDDVCQHSPPPHLVGPCVLL